jgi:hypothetical protein
MRKTLFPVMAIGAASLLTLTASLVAAQTTVPASVTETAKYVTDRLTTELKLTPEQIPKVQAINEKSTAELEKMIEKFAADTTAASDAALVQALVQTSHSNTAQLKTVLTPGAVRDAPAESGRSARAQPDGDHDLYAGSQSVADTGRGAHQLAERTADPGGG